MNSANKILKKCMPGKQIKSNIRFDKFSKNKIVTCVNCGNVFQSAVPFDPQHPEIALATPQLSGKCPKCMKLWSVKKVNGRYVFDE